MPASLLAQAVLISAHGVIGYRDCARYLHSVQQLDWFAAAFPSHSEPVTVVGGRGVSTADAALRRIKIGVSDRYDRCQCEQACLHELAHIVTPDYGPDRELREPGLGRDSSKGHHHAWRANFVFIVRMMLGKHAAQRLRHEFSEWGLATHK